MIDSGIVEEIEDMLAEEGGYYAQWMSRDAQRIAKEFPSEWKEAFQNHLLPEAIAKLWSGVSKHLPRFTKLLSAKTMDVVVVSSDTAPPSLLYVLVDESAGEFVAYRGYLGTVDSTDLSKKLPIDVSPLYAIHNGWVELASLEDGPLPMADWDLIETQDSKFLQMMSLEEDSMGFDLTESPAKAYMLWRSHQEVEDIEDFWPWLDDFLSESIEDFDNAPVAKLRTLN